MPTILSRRRDADPRAASDVEDVCDRADTRSASALSVRAVVAEQAARTTVSPSRIVGRLIPRSAFTSRPGRNSNANLESRGNHSMRMVFP